MRSRVAVAAPAVAIALVLAACARDPGAPTAGAAAPAPAYTLACHASNTATSAQVHCVRTDTRTGDVVRVDHARLPISNGPTASAPAPAGRYQLACTATATDQRSDFYCVRLDTQTGDLMLINLLKVGQIPGA